MRNNLRTIRALAAASLALVGVLAPISAASAHSELETSSPAVGEIVQAGKIDITLTFGEPLMASPDNAGLAISVQGPTEGSNVERTDGCLDSLDQAVMTEMADIDEAGTYTVNWRAVAEDGHPLEGSYQFAVENSTGYVADPVVSCLVKASENTLGGDVMNSEDKSQYLFGLSPYEGLIGGFIVIAIISVVGALLIKRKERIEDEKNAQKKYE